MIIDAISGVGGGGGTTIVQKPTVSVGTYTYDGTAQGPTITGFDSSKMTISGDSATNAGSYTLTIGLKNTNSMVWSDMTTADLTWSWSIGKADQTITLSSNSVTLDYEHLTASVTVSGAQGTISVSSSDSTVATASLSGSTVTINNVNQKTGSATLTVLVAGTTNYNPATDSTISVACAFAPDGSTVTPINDVQIWLRCAEITNKSYTTLNEVLADSTTLATLISSQNAVDYMVRSTSWATDVCANQTAMSLIGLNNYASNTLLADSDWLTAICNSTYFESVLNVKIPTMTSNTTPSGVVSVSTDSGTNTGDSTTVYRAFDGVANTSSNTRPLKDDPFNISYQFTSSKKMYIGKVHFYYGDFYQVYYLHAKSYKFQGYNGNSWVDLTSLETLENRDYGMITKILNNVNNYTAYRIYQVGSYVEWSNYNISYIIELQFYGREDV